MTDLMPDELWRDFSNTRSGRRCGSGCTVLGVSYQILLYSDIAAQCV
jgi:hypothetical protein